MTYKTVADIADSPSLRRRITACAAQQAKPDPEAWTLKYHWYLAASPGWAEAWESYLAGGPAGDPGSDETVITDGMILAAVEAIEEPVS